MTDLTPTEDDIAHATALRRELHRAPELSGHERETAARIAQEMRAAGAAEVIEGLGGTGVAAIFGRGARGIMVRAELDALPIREESGADHASERIGIAHLCGHDGHMAILVALARALGRADLDGRAILLFQPAEEDGAGARAVIADPRGAALAPDLAGWRHKQPGLALGHVALAEGAIGGASRGMRVRLSGRSAHASQPETGVSPRRALATLMEALPGLSSDASFPAPDFALVTVARVAMGSEAFGISPGDGELRATLRTLRDAAMADLVARTEALAHAAAGADGLRCGIDYHEVFEASWNDPAATAALRAALDDLGVPHGPEGQPWRPSEDFSRFRDWCPAAMLFLGAGEDQPPLHDPRYDFPDALIATGAAIFARTIAREIGRTV